ncbi:hypothetical protein Tco_1103781 [Tanacetum coccineum]
MLRLSHVDAESSNYNFSCRRLFDFRGYYQTGDDENRKQEWKKQTFDESMTNFKEAKDSEVCKITRAYGSSSFHGDFQALLRRLDRQDLSQLYSLVQERFKNHPLEGHGLDLWGDLRMIFDPNEEDDICRQEVSTEEGNLEEDDQLEDRSRRKLAMSSDNASSAVTYTSISSYSNGLSWGIPLVNVSELPEMDPYEEVAQQGQAHPLNQNTLKRGTPLRRDLDLGHPEGEVDPNDLSTWGESEREWTKKERKERNTPKRD